MIHNSYDKLFTSRIVIGIVFLLNLLNGYISGQNLIRNVGLPSWLWGGDDGGGGGIAASDI
jgi:hypothetical protein